MSEHKSKPFRICLTAGAVERMHRLQEAFAAASASETVRRALEIAERALIEPIPRAAVPLPTRAAEPVNEAIAVATEDPAIPPDDLALRRQRSLVAAFLRLDGREWLGTGPTPLEVGCQVSPAVLAEFVPGLAIVRERLAERAAEEHQFVAAFR